MILTGYVPLNEAPGDPPKDEKELKEPGGKAAVDPAAKPDAPKDPKAKPAAKPDADPADPPADDGSSDFNIDDDDNSDTSELGSDDPGDGSADGAPASAPDPASEKIKRERMYDSLVEIQAQCQALSTASEQLLDRIKDPVGQKYITRSKALIDEANEQCTTLRARFADLGYERVRDVYVTVRERVSAVAEIIKHVIDGDDDFRKPDSGPTN
jgi:hypothetical protein